MYSSDLRSTLMDDSDVCQTEVNVEKSKCPMVVGLINNVRTEILIDTGAEVSVISRRFINRNKKHFRQCSMLPINQLELQTAVNNKCVANQQMLITLDLDALGLEIPVIVVDKLIPDIIIGMDLLYKLQAVIDVKQQILQITHEKNNYRVTLNKNNSNEKTQREPIEISKPKVNIRDKHDTASVNNPDINKHQQSLINNLLNKYCSVFQDVPRTTNVYQHKIEVIDKSKFIRKTYPIPIHYRQQVANEIQRMLDHNIIERSDSDFVNPVVIVKKKNNDIRLCLDMRNLNSVTKKSFDCAPDIGSLFIKCQGVKYMSRLDLTNSFWQIPLMEDSRKYTAFLYNNKCFQFKVVPFGLNTSLSAIVKCLERALGPEVESFTNVFVDDILVISKSFEEHLKHLEIIFKKLKSANLVINKEKCEFLKSEIKFLGHIITAEGVATDPEKIDSIMKFPTPRNAKDIKAFLGLTGYYRRFTPGYADATIPLIELLKKGKKFNWLPCHQEAFTTVKNLFKNNMHLFHPDNKGTFVLYTDASDGAVGAVLYQRNKLNELKVIAYVNRTLKGAERNYFTSEKEILAIVYALSKLRYYLCGRKFEIHTDNQALTHLLTCKLTNARMTRWIIAIQEYDFTIKYCKGAENKTADILSRYTPEREVSIDNKHNDNMVRILNLNYKLSDNLKTKLKNISNEQESDPTIMDIKNKLRTNDIPNHTIINNTVYKSIDDRYKILLPHHLVEELTWACHLSQAHVGPYRCYLAMKEDFVCNNMVRKVKKILKTCEACQKANYPNYHTCVEMGTINAKEKGELVCVDFLGPLPRATRGYRHIVVCTDVFTKAVHLFPVQHPTTKAVLKAVLEKYIPTVGPIKKILSDQGKQFQNKVWHDTLQAQGIQPILTAIRRPQGNLAERVNKELDRLFRLYCFDRHNQWPRFIQFFEKSINENYHSTTGITPMELETGNKPERVWSSVIKSMPNANLPVPRQQKEKIAGDRMVTSACKRAERYNTSHRLVEFQVGERVLLKSNPVGRSIDNTATKFFRLFDGPYLLSEKVGKNTFIVLDEHRNKRLGKFHASSFRKYFPHD